MSSFLALGGGPDSLTVPLAPAPTSATNPQTPNGPAEVRLAGVDTKEKMYEPKQRKKLVRVLTVVAYLFFVSLAAVMLSLYYVFLWNPSPREERQRQQQQQQVQQQKQQQLRQLYQQPQPQQQPPLVLEQQEMFQHDDWSEDWSQGLSSTSLPDYLEATEIQDGDTLVYSGRPPHAELLRDLDEVPVSAPARRHHRDSNDIPRHSQRHGGTARSPA